MLERTVKGGGYVEWSLPKNYPGPDRRLSYLIAISQPCQDSPPPHPFKCHTPPSFFSTHQTAIATPNSFQPIPAKPQVTNCTMSSSQPAARSTSLNRDTNETKIQLSLNLDGGALEPFQPSSFWDNLEKNGEVKKAAGGHASQESKSQIIEVDSGIGFLDHMLHALAKHAGWSLRIRCRGDLHSTFFNSHIHNSRSPESTHAIISEQMS